MSVPSIGITIWGIVTGVAMVSAGLSVPLAILMTLVPFAGSAQLAVLPLLAVGAPLPVVWVTAALVNLRFMIFSAAIRKHFVHLPIGQKTLMAYLSGDMGSAMYMRRHGEDTEHGTARQMGYFFGLGITNWFVWMGASIIGILLGDQFPSSWQLDFAATLALVAVAIPMITRRPTLIGVGVTAAVSVVSYRLPMRLGLLVAVFAGVSAAFAAARILIDDATKVASS